MVNQTPKVTAVILNWNGKQNTLQCLDSLQRLDYPDLEVIVVDNASEDGSVEEIRRAFPEVSVIENKANLGFSEGNNVGIERALSGGAEYILLLNNDTVTGNSDLIGDLVSFAQKNGDAGLLSPLILYQGSETVWFAGGRVDYITGFCRHLGKGKDRTMIKEEYPYKVDYLSGCCMLARKDLLHQVGLFDPEYFLYYEDADLCFRAREQGYACYLVPRSWIYHKKSATSGIVGRNRLSDLQAYYFSRNALIFGRKNISGWRRVTYFCAQFTLRFAYNLFLLSSCKALKCYIRGLYEGARR